MATASKREDIDPSKRKLGEVFIWKNQMRRRGKGIIYRARPGAPFMTMAFLKRRVKRLKKAS